MRRLLFIPLLALLVGATPPVESFSEMYEANDSGSTITVTTAGTYYGWTTASVGNETGTGYAVFSSDATADRITIGANGAGTYAVTIAMSFGGTAGALVECALFDGGSEQTDIEFWRKLGATGDTGSAMCSGLISLSANDHVDLRCTSDDNGDEVDVYRANVSIRRVGP